VGSRPGSALALAGKTRVSACAPRRTAFSIADGIAVKKPGELTGPILDELLDEVVEVGSREIAQALVLLLERTKLVVEGAGAVGIAALLEGKIARRRAGRGRPLRREHRREHADRGRCATGSRSPAAPRRAHRVPDRPGELLKLLQLVAKERVNVLSVEHRAKGVDIPVGATGIDLTLLARDEEHSEAIVEEIRGWGYEVERLR
jgi:threonine dehydratase